MRTFHFNSRRVLLCAVALVLFLAFGIVGIAMWTINAHAIPMSRFKELRIGMTTSNSLKVLGQPSEVHKHRDGSQTWTYERGTWCNVTLKFSSIGELEKFDHDH